MNAHELQEGTSPTQVPLLG